MKAKEKLDGEWGEGFEMSKEWVEGVLPCLGMG